MPLPHVRPTIATSVVIAATALQIGCSGGAADSTAVVTGTDDACTMSGDPVAAGTVDVEFTNEADDVSELYILKANGDVVSEVENVTTGTTRTLTVDLVAGDYMIRCKPGQTGEGFTSDFAVTGEGGTPEATPDREITFEAVDFTYPDLDLSGISEGDTIRFAMTNTGDQPHEFEVVDPDGNPLGEVAATDPGASSGATISFDAPGDYTYRCILVDPDTGKEHTELGMEGAFEVSAD